VSIYSNTETSLAMSTALAIWCRVALAMSGLAFSVAPDSSYFIITNNGLIEAFLLVFDLNPVQPV